MHAEHEPTQEQVARAGEQPQDRPERRPPEEQHERDEEQEQQHAEPFVTAVPPERHQEADRDQDRDHRRPPAVEQLAAREPHEDLLGPERVVVDLPARVLVVHRPQPVGEQRHDDPGRDEQAADPDQGRAPDPAQELTPLHEREHAQREQREVAGQQVARDRQRQHERREPVRTALRDRPPRQAPRERQQPHPPQLCPGAVAAPRVAPPLVAERGFADDQGRGRRGDRADPSVPPQEPAPRVDRDRPQRHAQVHRPRERALAADRECQHARQHVRQALVVVEPRRSEREIGVPAVEREVSLLDAVARPGDHRPVHRGVVQVLDRARLRAEHHEVEQDDDPHHHERPARGRLGVRRFGLEGRGRLLAFGQGLAHPLMLPRLPRKPGQPDGTLDAASRPGGRLTCSSPVPRALGGLRDLRGSLDPVGVDPDAGAHRRRDRRAS